MQGAVFIGKQIWTSSPTRLAIWLMNVDAYPLI
jgi:hypothetical protein